MLIPLEPKVGLTSNQAVNSSLSVVSSSKKKLTNSDHEWTLAHPFGARVPPYFPLFMAWPKWKYLLAIFWHSLQQNWDQGTLGRQRSTLIGSGPPLVLPWPYNTPNMALYILSIFLHSKQQKWNQGTLGTKRSAPIGPSMDPVMALQYTWSGPSGFWDVRLVRPGLDWTQTRLQTLRARSGVL